MQRWFGIGLVGLLVSACASETESNPFPMTMVPVAPAPVGDGDTNGLGDGAIAPMGDIPPIRDLPPMGDTPPVGDGDMAPAGDGDTSPMGDGDNVPMGDGDNVPTGDGDTSVSGDGDMGDGDAPVDHTCTGKPGASGNETRTWNNVQYIVHFPPNLDPNQPVPLLFVAHGFTMSGALMQTLTNFDATADRDGFVVVYPNGDGGATPWNVGEGACAPGSLVNAPLADSLGYLDAMRASVEEDVCINPEQVFITGFSMGGYFSNHVGCQRGKDFAASGPHSGGTYPGECPGAPMPMFIMHGANDSFIDHVLCGQGARDFWIERNGCDSQFEARPVSGGSCEWYEGCDPNGQTVYCEFAGVGHSWAGQDATNAVWDFFKMYL